MKLNWRSIGWLIIIGLSSMLWFFCGFLLVVTFGMVIYPESITTESLELVWSMTIEICFIYLALTLCWVFDRYVDIIKGLSDRIDNLWIA